MDVASSHEVYDEGLQPKHGADALQCGILGAAHLETFSLLALTQSSSNAARAPCRSLQKFSWHRLVKNVVAVFRTRTWQQEGKAAAILRTIVIATPRATSSKQLTVWQFKTRSTTFDFPGTGP